MSPPKPCEVCNLWLAEPTPLGWRCHTCESRDWALAHPVPLPENPQMLADLAMAGVDGALEKLREKTPAFMLWDARLTSLFVVR